MATTRSDFVRSDVQYAAPELIGIDQQMLNTLESRWFALETVVVEMRGILLAEMRSMNARPAEPVVPAVQVSVAPVEKAPESMDALEKLLLERLSKRDPVPTVVDAGVKTSVPREADLERTRIMDLLKQLEPEAVDQGGTPLTSVVPEADTASDGGFVTLSDYINQVLKAESMDQKKAN